MSAATTVPNGTELCHLPARFPLDHGGDLVGGVLAYERQGPRGAPLVVVLGGISAGRHVAAHAGDPAAGWWDGLVGAGRAIDTREFAVLGIDWLGAPGASTSPRPGERLPFVATADQAQALTHLLDELGIDRVHAIVGSSYGGMVALQFAAKAGARLDRLAVLAAAHESHPQASALRSVQRGILALGARVGEGAVAVALARSLAMVSYRSPDELGERFAGPPRWRDDGPWPPVADWLEARGRAFAERWNAEQFACLCASVDAHRVDPKSVDVPTTTIAFSSDQLVPPAQVRDLAARLPRLVGHREIASPFGHDAFLREATQLAPVLREVLA